MGIVGIPWLRQTRCKHSREPGRFLCASVSTTGGVRTALTGPRSISTMNMRHPRWILALLPALTLVGALCAQPSGGPYGPQPQTYEVPKAAAHVYYVAPDGKADAPGATVDAPSTLESALARVVTGDAIILRG